MTQCDLFDAQPIAGLLYRPRMIDSREEEELVEAIERLDLTPFRFRNWVARRETIMFGWAYDFQRSSFEPAAPMPHWLDPLREKAALLSGRKPDDFVQVLIARYSPGAGIGWHRDRPQFGDIVGISLASDVDLRFRQRTEGGFRRSVVTVERRSAYLLSGEVRGEWEHSIAASPQLRYSLTLRTLSKLGRRQAGQS